MSTKRARILWATGASLLVLLLLAGAVAAKPASMIVQLGDLIYHDAALSEPDGQSCASCHALDAGTVDPDTGLPVSEGVIPGLYGGRNAPMAAYAMYVPSFHLDPAEGLYVGGLFWDGRATGQVTGDPLADQALGPPMNPVEMANPDKETYVQDIRDSAYAQLFKKVWGARTLQKKYTDQAYLDAALSVAAFERSAAFARFDSKYDRYLATCLQGGGAPEACAQGVGPEAGAAAAAILTAQEWQGLLLFMGANNNDGVVSGDEGAGCAVCHVAGWTQQSQYSLPVQVPGWAPAGMVPPLFTDHSFDNLGAPRNLEFPFTPDSPIDLGLGTVLGDTAENGKHRVMTVRNIGLTPPYLHNGVFDTVLEVTHFYNARDVDPSLPDPEVAENVNVEELGNLGLSPEQEAALVAFMLTLDDGTW